MIKAELVSNQGSQVESWKEGMVVLYPGGGNGGTIPGGGGKGGIIPGGREKPGHRNRAVEA